MNCVKCIHPFVTYLDEFDGDGDIIIRKVICSICNQTGYKTFDVIESKSIWDKRFITNCRHSMYKIDDYLPISDDFVSCKVHCLSCNFSGTNIYKYAVDSSIEWSLEK